MLGLKRTRRGVALAKRGNMRPQPRRGSMTGHSGCPYRQHALAFISWRIMRNDPNIYSHSNRIAVLGRRSAESSLPPPPSAKHQWARVTFTGLRKMASLASAEDGVHGAALAPGGLFTQTGALGCGLRCQPSPRAPQILL